MHDFTLSFLGGCLIGISATIMLLFNGRIAGISGILNGFLKFEKHETFWRTCFISGLLAGGLALSIFMPTSIENTLYRPLSLTILGGLLVGFGTLMGGGCTSGHGVCGISRLSIRSIIATLCFMCLGFLTVYLLNHYLL